MKVQKLMTSQPLTCGPTSNLAEVTHLMWNGDCGIVPIVDDGGKLLGVVTDRDICIATATQNKSPARIKTEEMPHGDIFTCRPDDDAQVALTLMRDHRVRRVPVTSADGTLVGILSLNDLALAAAESAELSAADVLNALKGICAHTQPLAAATATKARKAGAGA